MKQKVAFFFITLSVFSFAVFLPEVRASERIIAEHVTVSINRQFPAVRPQSSSALALSFETEKDWHFYASAKTAPGGANLKVKASSKNDFLRFSEPLFPQSEIFEDKLSGEKVDTFNGNFTIYIPFTVKNVVLPKADGEAEITVIIDGAMCSGESCIWPKFAPLTIGLKISADADMTSPAFTLPQSSQKSAAGGQQTIVSTSSSSGVGILAALLLAFLAGVILNIMPCVLPVIPLKVLSIFEQARQDKKRSVAMGSAFCAGILLFFAILAGINVSLHLRGQGSIQWGGHFQNPANIIAMSLLLIILALFMFGVFTISPSSSIAGKGQGGKGIAGSVAMGFFAAILSTPCSFGILTASLLWAQTQNLFIGTIAIMVIGIGMAAPYMVLTSTPSLLKFVPRAGRWTELFKQTTGFILLAVAMWLLMALPKERFERVLYFSVILSFCLWMWGGWVTFNTPRLRKYIIRLIAIAIVIPSGIFLLPEPAKSDINWQEYDALKIKEAVAQGRPVLIDFTADWCLNCKAVDRFVYGNSSVGKLLNKKGVLAFKGDATEESYPAAIDIIKVYKEPAVPVTILLHRKVWPGPLPGQAEPVKLRGILIKGKLLEYLEQLPDATKEQKIIEKLTRTDPNG
jgi:thiol:disulfide interchange protein